MRPGWGGRAHAEGAQWPFAPGGACRRQAAASAANCALRGHVSLPTAFKQRTDCMSIASAAAAAPSKCAQKEKSCLHCPPHPTPTPARAAQPGWSQLPTGGHQPSGLKPCSCAGLPALASPCPGHDARECSACRPRLPCIPCSVPPAPQCLGVQYDAAKGIITLEVAPPNATVSPRELQQGFRARLPREPRRLPGSRATCLAWVHAGPTTGGTWQERAQPLAMAHPAGPTPPSLRTLPPPLLPAACSAHHAPGWLARRGGLGYRILFH